MVFWQNHPVLPKQLVIIRVEADFIDRDLPMNHFFT